MPRQRGTSALVAIFSRQDLERSCRKIFHRTIASYTLRKPLEEAIVAEQTAEKRSLEEAPLE